MLTNFWFDPYVVFKHGFHKSVLPYFKKYIVYVLLIIPPFLICSLLINQINISNNFLYLILCILITTIVVNACFALFFFRSKEMKYIINNLKNIKNKMKGKRK